MIFPGLLCGLALLRTVASVAPDWKHTNALRTIDLTKAYARISTAVILENISKDPQSTYHLPSIDGIVYSHFEVREKGGSPEALEVSRNDGGWTIILPKPISAGDRVTLSISQVLLDSLHPLPAKMEQNGQQYLTFSTSKLLPSFYTTEKEKTKFKLPTSDVPHYTPGGELQASTLTYGPYTNGADRGNDIISIRFEHTVALPIITYFERDIEVSHWGGNIAFEDRYAITNNAARLASQFDRIAFAQSGFYNPKSAAVRSLAFKLPVGTRDAYFTDEIGNVSTSKFRSSLREAHLEIKPRYPIFGGWNYTFVIGWNNELSRFLKRDQDRHQLTIPFLEGADDLVYEDVRVRIILPEGAEGVQVKGLPDGTTIKHAFHKTFMDTTGRSVVVLEAQNLTEDKARTELVVSYNYSTAALYRKPLVMFAAAMTIFGGSFVLGKAL